MVVESELVFVLMVTSQHLKLFNATWATAVILTGVVGLVVAVIPEAKMCDFDSVVAVLAIQLKKYPNHATSLAL
jgi:hypothetical protein